MIKNIKVRGILLLTGVGIFCLINALAGSSQAGESDDFFFAEKLRKDGMYVAAAEEFIRFSEKYPHSSRRPSALVNAGECYMKAGRAGSALDVFSAFMDEYPGHQSACKVKFYRGTIFKMLKQYNRAADELIELSRHYVDCSLVRRALVEAGDCLLSDGNSQRAASVLKDMIEKSGQSPYIPRARYILSMALENIGRDLQADDVLKDIVDENPSSPFAALALMELGEKAAEEGNIGRAIDFYRNVADNFEEESLRERSIRALVDLYFRQEDDSRLLDEGSRYLEMFPRSEHSGEIFRKTVYASWHLNKYQRALSLIQSAEERGVLADSTGEFKLLKARIFYRRNRYRKALDELDNFRSSHPRSGLWSEVSILRGELFIHTGSPDEAFRCYNLALSGDLGTEQRLSLLSRIADLSLKERGDTLSALGYLDIIVNEGGRDKLVRESLWRVSRLREEKGERASALAGYHKLVRLFGNSDYADSARSRIEYLDLTGKWTRTAARELLEIASSDLSPGERAVETGVILLDEVGDNEGAEKHLRLALQRELNQEQRSRALYHLGRVQYRKYSLSELKGEPEDDCLDRAMDIWTELAGRPGGGVWRERAHRTYLKHSLSKWDLNEQFRKLNEYISTYRNWPRRYWAVDKKIELLYQKARDNHTWAADSALHLAEMTLKQDIPAEYRKEVVLKYAYLNRLKRKPESAAGYFRDFIADNEEDIRITGVYYDLGEVLFSQGDYEEALDAYVECLERNPSPLLEARCYIRAGDCHYSLKNYSNSVDAYRQAGSVLPGSKIAYDADYRRSIALIKLDRRDQAEDIFRELYRQREKLAAGTRLRLLRRLGRQRLDSGRVEEAAAIFEELVSLNQSGDNLVLLASARMRLGQFDLAEKWYTRALRSGEVDSCSALGGRAKNRLKEGDFDKAIHDIEILAGHCPDSNQIPGIYLEKARVEISNGNHQQAQATLNMIREKYPRSSQAVESLYYLALCDLERGGQQEAVDKLERMLREAPTSALAGRAYFKLASAHYHIGNQGLAARNYRLSAESTDDENLSFMAWKNVAHIYQEMEDYQKAASAWERISEGFPGREGIVEVFFNLGFCYNRMQKHQLAYQVYSRIPVVAIDDRQNGRAHYWAGISLKNMKKYQEAVREFLRVPYLMGGMWAVTSKLEAAECYEHLDQFDRAVSIYRKVIENRGENSDWGKVAAAALERIEGGKGERDESP